MDFSRLLNHFIAILGITARQLSDVSGVSAAVISRYRSGDRVPSANSKQVSQLAEGISLLSEEKLENPLSASYIREELVNAITGIDVEYEAFVVNLRQIVSALSISNNELARALSFDPSYVSRILAGKRHPADLPQFINGTARYIARNYSDEQGAPIIASVCGCTEKDALSEASCMKAVTLWLSSNIQPSVMSVSNFIEKVDELELDEYLEELKVDEMKLGSGANRPTRRVFEGTSGLVEAELEFLRTVILSDSSDEVIMYSDMPMSPMQINAEAKQQWIKAMALLLKKGLHINVIHNVNRSAQELFVNANVWIPMYVSGQVTPYYLPAEQSSVFKQHLRTAGNVALTGNCISSFEENGRFMLTEDPEDVSYLAKRTNEILMHALPLMRAYRNDGDRKLRAFIKENAHKTASWTLVTAAPPLLDVSRELISQICAHNNLTPQEERKIITYIVDNKAALRKLFPKSTAHFLLPRISKEEYERAPVNLPLSGLFFPKDVKLTYEEYSAILSSARAYCRSHPNCSISLTNNLPVRNIQIIICNNRFAVIVRNTAPIVHFVTTHPSLISMFELSASSHKS